MSIFASNSKKDFPNPSTFFLGGLECSHPRKKDKQFIVFKYSILEGISIKYRAPVSTRRAAAVSSECFLQFPVKPGGRSAKLLQNVNYGENSDANPAHAANKGKREISGEYGKLRIREGGRQAWRRKQGEK